MTKRLINDKIEPVNDKINRGDLMIDKAKRNAAVQRYQAKSQYRTFITLHTVNDKEIIDYIAEQRAKGISPSQLFREWYKAVVKVNDDEVYNFENAVELMDDEIRERLHNEMAPCTDKEFFDAYCKEHLKKYGEEFTY